MMLMMMMMMYNDKPMLPIPGAEDGQGTNIQVSRCINQLLTKRSSVRSNGTRALIAVGDKNSDSTPYSLYKQHAL